MYGDPIKPDDATPTQQTNVKPLTDGAVIETELFLFAATTMLEYVIYVFNLLFY